MRRVAVALFLGGALMMGLLLLMTPHIVQSAPPPPVSDHGLANPSQVAEHRYDRVQTVTLRLPTLPDIYTTTFTTTFQIQVFGFHLGDWLWYPTDGVTIAGECGTNPSCSVIWEEIEGRPAAKFTGTAGTTDTVYLAYDTKSRAFRIPDSRVIDLAYPVGFVELTRTIGLTNTVVFSRPFHPLWGLNSDSVAPVGYDYDDVNRTLRWGFTDTARLEFTSTFTEPLLGSDLVIERLEMGDIHPELEDLVQYTVTVRNVGTYRTGRAVLTELFVRPPSLGPPTVLTDHVGGWTSYTTDALFKWSNDSYWWAGLEPGEEIIGTTVLTWPIACGEQGCGVWAKVDPSYLDLGTVYAWWGYNPEGIECGMDDSGFPTCEEENNNLAEAWIPTVYLPLVLRNSQ